MRQHPAQPGSVCSSLRGEAHRRGGISLEEVILIVMSNSVPTATANTAHRDGAGYSPRTQQQQTRILTPPVKALWNSPSQQPTFVNLV